MPALPPSLVLKSIPALLLLSLAARAQEPAPPTAPPHETEAAAPAPAPAAAPAANPLSAALQALGAPKPFMDVIHGAVYLPGFLPLFEREDKVWIELRPDQFDQPFFMSLNIPNGIGERGLYGSQMGESHVIYFHRIGNLVQMIAKNTGYGARPGTPEALEVSQGYSDSLLATANVVSAPHPQSHAVLIEANTLLFGDVPGFATRLETVFRLPFAIDPRNTSFVSLRADEGMTGLGVNAHFLLQRMPAPPLTPSPVPLPAHPATLPDPRSMFIGFYYSFMPLPAQPMHSRRADDRIGHFVTTSHDFTDDLKPTSAIHVVNRWRLEKQDPSLPLSEPKQPIVYWIDRNVPEKYRQAVTEGVLAWNAAFERIGFKNAIVVKQQTEHDFFNTLDARHTSIRWYVGNDANYALGPFQVDPRSGEILNAHIAFPDTFTRIMRRFASEDTPAAPPSPSDAAMSCDYAQESAQEMGFAEGLLEARGELDMDSPKAEALAQAYVRAVVMHEVGHTLGLRHNFRASTIYTEQQLEDADFTKKNGLAGSVMDYAPFNLAVKGEKQGEYLQSTLGPYDYWAIEYAYKPIAPADEEAELAKIAARSNEPRLAFGNDQDAGGSMSDPDVNAYDLGSDPLAYFQKRLAISRELWDRLQTRQLKPGDSYETLRRSFDDGFNQFARAVPLVVKYIGGVTYVRDHAGTGRATFTPVPLARQRTALTVLTDNLFKTDSFKFAPEFISRLGANHFEPAQRADVSVGAHVLGLQAAALDHLMSDAVAARVVDSQEKVEDSRQVLGLDELYATLQSAIWSELKTGKDISAMRRNLQREHLKRLANALLKPSANMPADVRSLQRENALDLQREIAAALGKAAQNKAISREAKAHLAESYETISQALKASMLRAGA